MVLRFNKGRMATTAAACLAGCVVGIILLVVVFDFAPEDSATSILRGGLLGATVAAGLFAVVFLIHSVNADKPVVTIDERGVEFHRPEIGLIPWTSIDRAGVERILGAKRLAVYVRPPAPKPGFATKLLFALVAAKRGDTIRLIMPFGRFGATEAAVQGALDAHRARA